MSRIPILAIFLFMITLVGCDDDEEKDESFVCQQEDIYPCIADSGKVNLRIVNVSSYDYCNVKVRGDRMYKNYGEILKGDTSCSISFDTISNLLSIRLIFEGDTAFAPRPGEYINSSYLTKGFYICKLSLTPVFFDSLLRKRYGYLDTEILPD